MASAAPSSKTWEIQGQNVSMPVVVRDAGSGNAMFMVPAAAAQKLIPGDVFRVLEAAPGQTQCLLAAIDYRDNDLGDYNEAAIIFFVYPAAGTPAEAGTYIYKLPVNQDFTREAGSVIWGFPKTVEEIDIRYSDDRVTCRLDMDGQHVFTLSLARGAGEPAEEQAPVGYTYIEGVAHRTQTTIGGKGTLVTPGPDGVELTLGSHPIADELRSLGLPLPALMCTWTEHMNGTFQAPERL